jgi:hypothetical protein
MLLPISISRSSFDGLLVSITALMAVWGCSSQGDGPTQGTIIRETAPSPLGTTAPGPTGDAPANPSGVQEPSQGDIGDGIGQLPTEPTNDGPVAECASTSQPTQLQGVTLVFAFDVSGSMASDEVAREFKWEPISLAAKTFFSSPESADVSAQLTFFPGANVGGGFGGGGGGGGGGGQTTCSNDDYMEPDIPLTALPSDEFGATIDATEPNRLGTPTRWILPAVIDQAIALREAQPSSYAVVLVTDGLPTVCTSTDADDVGEVAALAAAGPAAGIPVYVIGVDTPADATVGAGENGIANLNLLAQQGGTDSAFIIDTGDVDKTVADFVAVVNTIKESTFACNMPIPAAPPGQAFDATKVNVTFKSDQQQDLVYDPTCATEWAWKYDDEQNPTSIVLCDVACSSVKSYTSTAGSVDVQFGCERRVVNR